MRWGLSLLMVSILLDTGAAPARGDESLAERVHKSIQDGKGYLLDQQRPNGSWEILLGDVSFPGGATSLALLALLTTGESPRSEAIQNGLRYLRTIEPRHTYAIALQTMAFAQAGEGQDRERIQRNVKWLIEAEQDTGWSYTKAGATDNSNTHYAIMGLAAADKAGVEVDAKTLTKIYRRYLKSQLDNGGWPYKTTWPRATLSMTAASLHGLLLTERDRGGENLRADGSAERCGIREDRKAEKKALQVIGANLPAAIPRDKNREGLGMSCFYCLHALESVGLLSGRRYFGERDWYEIGSRWLIATQGADGSWRNTSTVDRSPIVATSFALLFLASGRTPVLIAKLAYGPRDYDGWNNKSADLRHLVAFTGRELFHNQPLAWQIFDVRGGNSDKAEEPSELAKTLREVPIIFFNGHDSVPRGREEALLKEYLAKGGVVFAEACCGDKRFDDAFRSLAKRLYPDAELKPIAANHELWKASRQFTLTPNDWPLLGVEHKGRMVIIYSPKPLAGYWQADSYNRGRGQLAFRIGASVLAYATGLKIPPPRGSRTK